MIPFYNRSYITIYSTGVRWYVHLFVCWWNYASTRLGSAQYWQSRAQRLFVRVLSMVIYNLWWRQRHFFQGNSNYRDIFYFFFFFYIPTSKHFFGSTFYVILFSSLAIFKTGSPHAHKSASHLLFWWMCPHSLRLSRKRNGSIQHLSNGWHSERLTQPWRCTTFWSTWWSGLQGHFMPIGGQHAQHRVEKA